MTTTEHYGLNKPGGSDYAKIDALNENADALDAALHEIETGKEELLKDAPVKETPADADGVVLVDAGDQKTRKLLWSRVKAALKGWMDTLYAAAGHKHTAADVGARPDTWVPTAAQVGADPAGSAAAAKQAAISSAAADAKAKADQAEANAKAASTPVAHVSDAVKHITAAERESWNGKEGAVKGAGAKTTLSDGDGFVLVDTTSATKRITWANVVTAVKGKLGTVYAALSHTHVWGDIDNAPTSMAPTAHSHGSITSDGKVGSTANLPLFTGAGGAVGTKTAAAARTALGALGAFPPTAITISATWSGTGPWTQNVAVSGVKASWDWRLGLHLAKITDDATRKLQEKAMMCITWCETYDGGITLTCREKKPDVAIQAVLSGEV